MGVVAVAAGRGGELSGQGEEHVVEGRLVQGHVLGGDAGGMQPAQRLGQGGRAMWRRDHDPAGVPVVGPAVGPQGPQRL
jgi:hypothetical protein